jgi:acyl-coenzyme A thioesterase PaaI-like protein
MHLGKRTQVRDAEVIDCDSAKTIALSRCTQMILCRALRTIQGN